MTGCCFQRILVHAVQECRIKYRWESLDQEAKEIATAKQQKVTFRPEILSNGDTLKQLLARSRYLLFKHHIKWTEIQKSRAILLFERYPELKKAYNLSLGLGNIFKICTTKEQTFKPLALWYNQVEESGIESSRTLSRSIQAHYLSILNFFLNRKCLC